MKPIEQSNPDTDRASGYIERLTDGRYSEIQLDDQYNIIVLEDAIPKPVISGGEEDLANLVLRLAISEMIAERAGQSFSLLILDEVFGSLDEARRHNVVDLLRRLQDRRARRGEEEREQEREKERDGAHAGNEHLQERQAG